MDDPDPRDSATVSAVDQEIVIECPHCLQGVSSRVIDEHESQCSNRLSLAKIKKQHELPATKIQSTELNQIKSLSSDNEDFTSVERTPSRNKVVHMGANSSNPSLNGCSSAFKGMDRLNSGLNGSSQANNSRRG